MKSNKSFIIKALLLTLFSIVLGFYTIPMLHDSEFEMVKVMFIYQLVIVAALFWVIAVIYRTLKAMASDVLQRNENIEKILLDIRDGTKSFFKEKRRSLRMKVDIVAHFDDKSTGDDFVKISDISSEGAMLRTTKELRIGECVKLRVYLPLFTQPIILKARINRSHITKEVKGASPVYDIGIEFIDITESDRELITETIDILSRATGKN